MADAKSNGQQPEFDFSNFSYKKGKRMRTIQNEVRRCEIIIDLPDPEEPSKHIQLAQDKIAALDKLDDLNAELDELVASIVISLPKNWLVTDLEPGMIGQLKGVELVEQMQSSKMPVLLNALSDHMNEVNEESKN